jgi:hypothetical protein
MLAPGSLFSAVTASTRSPSSCSEIPPGEGGLLVRHVRSCGRRRAPWQAVLGYLREAGFSIEMTIQAYSVLDADIYGFARYALDLILDAHEALRDSA